MTQQQLTQIAAVLLAVAFRRLSSGFILHEDSFRVVIATGFVRRSCNDKTTDNSAERDDRGMIQIWILNRSLHPQEAVKLGKTKHICGDCPHQHAVGGKCYVQVGRAPTSVWRCYQRGGYPRLPNLAVFAGNRVRFGAYGDPSYIPHKLIGAIADMSDGWTGYTHQWRVAWNRDLANWFMASVDSVEQQLEATRAGWRTFRVGERVDKTNPRPGWRLHDEINCPASMESGHKSSCERCLLCCGNAKQGVKNVEIGMHGNN